MENIDCHYGDHDFERNGYCKWCGKFNGSWLRYQAFEKAEREGRAHVDHYHRTLAAKEKCEQEVKYDALDS